jgi:hypothetical protein
MKIKERCSLYCDSQYLCLWFYDAYCNKLRMVGPGKESFAMCFSSALLVRETLRTLEKLLVFSAQDLSTCPGLTSITFDTDPYSGLWPVKCLYNSEIPPTNLIVRSGESWHLNAPESVYAKIYLLWHALILFPVVFGWLNVVKGLKWINQIVSFGGSWHLIDL